MNEERARTAHPVISVVICTFNRVDLLVKNLASLNSQTIGKDYFEVLVVDDGSTDGTRQAVKAWQGRLPLRYFFQNRAGPAAARNHGLFAARGDLVFFFDDDDTAAPDLLEEHVRTHKKNSGYGVAVLNHTGWHPDLRITPVMRYVTDEGYFLFSYPAIRNGDVLDYRHFWCGRISCKRSLLVKEGVFSSLIREPGYEDIELGYRLSLKAGLKVIYNARARSFMVRPVTFNSFCARMAAQGRSAHIFTRLHDSPSVREYCGVDNAGDRWAKIAGGFESKIRAAWWLDRMADLKEERKIRLEDSMRQILQSAYSWSFKAYRIKGAVEAARRLAKDGDIRGAGNE